MTHKALLGLAGIFISSLVPHTLTAQYQSQDLTTRAVTAKTILILPAEATVLKSSVKGFEPITDEAQTLGSEVISMVGKTLSEKGCEIFQDPSFSADALDRNADLKYALANLQSQYDKLQVLVLKRPKDVVTGRFSLGEEVTNFGPGASADALVFVRARATIPTKGMKTLVVLSAMGNPFSHVSIDIAVIGAQTGKVLYFAKPVFNGDFVGKPEEMKEPIAKSLQSFGSYSSHKN